MATTIPLTAGQDDWASDGPRMSGHLARQLGPHAAERPAVSSGFLAMTTILAGFALFWLAAGFGLGYWVAG